MNDLSNCSSSEPFALRVVGDDMAPEFVDGHVIIVDPGGKPRLLRRCPAPG
jgi:phage repressor protein C with HTH and peptisase S24 domain